MSALLPGGARHDWVDAPGRSQRAAMIAELELPELLVPAASAHRRLRGPYTAAGTIVRGLATRALEQLPELVAAHETELLAVAPELRDRVTLTRETLTSRAGPKEQTRFHSRLRTLRIAHGLAEFLRDYAAAAGGPRALVVDQADAADQTDQEFLAVLLRRLDPARLTLAVGTGGPVAGPLAAALGRYAARPGLGIRVLATGPAAAGPVLAAGLAAAGGGAEAGGAPAFGGGAAGGGPAAEGPRARGRAYVAADGTADEPGTELAYLGLPATERAALHDARAAELEAAGEPSLRLGAIPYHREHGGDPAGAGAAALREALDSCIGLGCYEATVDLGRRGRAVIGGPAQLDQWWAFTTRMAISLAALGRPAEAEDLYDEARATVTSLPVHMEAAYATAMLYTRHHGPDRRDDARALGWINEAIAIAAVLPDPAARAIATVFNQNGLALIRNRMGAPAEALRLVSEGLDRLAADVDPGRHRLHRSVLRHNRAQVYAGMGRLADALAEYTAVIEEDPNYPEYHFERAGILRRLGRDDEARTEYETATRLSPPFPELYYNRAGLLADQGDLDGALADLSYVLELDPEYADAYLNRADIAAGRGDLAAARRDVTAGLAVAPHDPHLLTLLARVELEEGHHAAARAAADAAVRAGEAVAEAWATRAAVAFADGDAGLAVADLTRAVDLAPDPVILFNRGCAHQALENWRPAEADFTAALEADPDDAETWRRRAQCRDRLGDAAGAGDDLRQYATLGRPACA